MSARIYLTIFCILIGLPVYAAAGQMNDDISSVDIVSSDAAEIILNFDLTNLNRTEVNVDGNAFEHFSISDEGVVCENNRPMLPAVIRFVVVPPDAGLELVVNSGEPRVVQAELPPALYETEVDETVIRGRMPADESGDAKTGVQDGPEGLFPPVIAKMSEPIVIRGVRLVKITTYPVQYDYDNNSYIHHDRIETEIQFTDAEPVNPARRPVRRNRSREFLKYIEALAINGDIVGRDDPEADIEPEYVGHYLVVCHEGVLEYAAPFIEWRRKSGWKMDILSLNSGQASNYNTVLNLIRERYNDYLDNGIDPFDYILLIGDRARYLHGPGPQNVLQAYQDHGDYYYGLLEGNDDFPDVAISRWPSGSRATCELAVGRTLAYEAYPYMEDTSWFTRGAVYSQHWGNTPNRAWHPTNPLSVRWGNEVLQRLGFDDIHVYEDFEYDQFAARLGPEIVEMFNNQTNVMIGRAELYHFTSRPPNRNANDFNREVDDNVVFPMEINTCGHGEWSRENMFRQGSGDHLKGYVATTYTWSGPQTLPNNALWLKMVNGVLQRDMPFGWGYTYAITSFETLLDRTSPNFQWYRVNFDDFGDPGLQPWIGVPTVVEADVIDSASPETRMVEVHVFEPENENDVFGAQVTIYHPNDMPDFDDDDYAGYDEMFMLTKKTGPDGVARFVFDGDVEFETGTMYVTVTGRAICPYFAEIEIDEPDAAIELAEYALTETEGNEDGEINPGETFTLALTAKNVGGENAVEDVAAVVSSASPWIEIAENEISFGNIGAGDEAEGDSPVTIQVSDSCPDGESRPITRPDLTIEFTSGQTTWHSGIRLNPAAPNFIISEIVGGEIIEIGEQELNVEIENIGGLDSPPLNATLISQGLGVNVINEEARFPEVDAGESVRIEGEAFSVAGTRVIVPGSRFDLILILSSEGGFVDTARFELQVEEARANTPTGPDNYGYVCFDDTDDEWDQAPAYDWIEISLEERDRDFNGELLDFDGRSPHDIGEAIVVDLGFTTQFYGYEYDAITVTTNGFITMGEQPLCTNYQNWPLDEGFGGGAGMIAPLWDNLSLGNDGGVYIYRDNDEHRMIIEWHRLRHRTGGNNDLTFQAVIYDKRFWVTATGDQMILFQYKSVSNVQGNADWNVAIPYASVGISSPEGNSGINYTYNNDYPVTAARLEDERALLFATSMQYFRAGSLWGHVFDFAADEPIEDATIITDYGFVARTDDEGYWEIPQALAEVPFSITARKLGYNDSTYTDTLLAEEDTLEISFELLHPEFTPSHRELSAVLDRGLETELEFQLENTGIGPLFWSVERRLLGDANADPWTFRRSYNVGEVAEDTRINGVVFINEHFYVSGAGEDMPMIYIFNREGELTGSFEQPQEDSRGMRDLAWDGELLWGSTRSTVYGMDLEGDVIHRWESEINPTTTLTWDSDREVLWMSGTTTDIIAYTRDGERVEAEIDRRDLRIYGLAYFPDDPDDFKLYILHRDRDTRRQIVHKSNTESNDTMFVADIEPEVSSRPEGAFITNAFDVYSWVLIAIANASNNDGGDRVDIWQIDARKDWFQLDAVIDENREEASAGTLQTGEITDFILSLNSTDLPETTFVAELFFTHNADSGRGYIGVELDVIGPMPPLDFDLIEPSNNDTVAAPIVHFEWNPSHDPNDGEEVRYRMSMDIDGQILEFGPDENTFDIDFDTLNVDQEWMRNNYSTWWVDAISGEDTTECLDRFNFMLKLPPAPPSIFELSYPQNEAVLDSTVISFRWEPSFDQNPEDSVYYRWWIAAEGNSFGYEAADTAITIQCDSLDFDIVWLFNNYATWWVNAISGEDTVESADRFTFKFSELAWINFKKNIPVEFSIESIYPSPFNSTATIRFGADRPERTAINVYDLSGRKVATLFDQVPDIGWHSITWNGANLPSGVYLVNLTSGGRSKLAKIALLK